jgi:ribulose 1,5-bisphosphate carboxylase large subunit-like protein
MGCQFNECSQIQTFLVKIQIDVMFWFENDLKRSTIKTHLDNTKDDEKFKNNKKMRMLTKIDKITTKNKKRCQQNTLETPKVIRWK